MNFLCCQFSSMSVTLPSEASFSQQRISTVSMPPNFFSQPSDVHAPQVSQNSRKKNSISAPPLSPLHSPTAPMTFNTTTEKVLCRPYRHNTPDMDMLDSFNNVDLNNSHDRVSMVQNNEAVPPPKPPRRASANPRIPEFNNNIVNGSRSNTTSPEPGSGPVEEPPPIPVKKKNRKTLG